MTAQRKDFDLNREYSVDVSNCTEEEKKKIQQAFFDVGISWELGHNTYENLGAIQYTNTTGSGVVGTLLMYGNTTEDCNMTAKEFLGLVYEPEQVGHVHADLMAQYAEDAKTHATPWKLWQFKTSNGDWFDCSHHPYWNIGAEFRRKPRTHLVNGVEVPDLRIKPKNGQEYWYLCTSTEYLVWGTTYGYEKELDKLSLTHNCATNPQK